ncbi:MULTISPECIES: DUF378 domain-containing protein [unclassified Clostridium]|uniref:DUF378 domain-containing protein n=1 Tax=unclassified Clostridium TaxID=2614128 RepID=UPI000297DB15|nr:MULTISPECIES: DUF378 domain-containing protein [unclassified Clostridium]EKQ50186.1 MAG: hypothetical protein A370_05891 [Clostridium sp. Maddingley MBC34-26]
MRTVTWVLVVAAAIRLGIIGFFGDDFIGVVFGSAPVAFSWVDRVICGIVGIAGIYAIYLLFKGPTNEVV